MGVSLNLILTKDHNYAFYMIRTHLFSANKLFLVKQINSLALYFFQDLNKFERDFIKNRRAEGLRLTPNYVFIYK